MAKPQRTVLIVDGSSEDRATYRHILERDPDTAYTCHEAATAADGLSRCGQLQPDAILLSCQLPGDEGLALLAQLAAPPGAYAIVMLASHGQEALAVRALRLGAQDYLVKDQQAEQRLSLAIESAILKATLQRQVEQQRRDLATSDRQLEQALSAQQASDQRLQLALQAMRMASWEWELDTNQVRWGAGLEEMLGMAPGMFGGTLEAFFALVHPDDLAYVRRELDRALHQGAAYEVEFRMLRPDGDARWAASRGHVVRDEGGRPIRMLGIDMDITERKRADAALRESEERYRALVSATSDLVWRANADGEMLFISPLWNELTGQSASELLGWGWAATIHPDDVEPAVALWREALASRGVYENEFRVRTSDGSYRRFHGRGVPILAADGSVREWIGYSSDITDRKQAEAELRRSEAQFKALVENAPDIIARFDRELRHLYVSPAITRATGLAPEALIGKTNRELGMPSDSCALWDGELRRVFETGQRSTFEFSYHSPNGVRFYESTVIPELADDGTFETVMSIVRDVTAHKQAEQRLRFLSDASTTLAASLDYQETLEQIARLAIPYLGDACIIDLIEQDQGIRSIVSHADPDLEAALREMRRRYPPAWGGAHPAAEVLRTRQPLIIGEVSPELIESHAHNDSHRELIRLLALKSFVMVPLELRGRAVGVISVYTTHAARSYAADDLALLEELARRAALALEHAQLYQEAQEAIREREDFFSIASHEIKNPLTSLLGRAQLLQRRLGRLPDAQPARQDAELIIAQTRRINTLLSDMLDVSRLASGQFVLERAPLDLGALVQHVAAAMQLTTSAHTINVRAGAAVVVAGDAGRLEQVFHNLVGNAVKYSPAGGTITVELAVVDGYAQVTISDTGLGIPPEALPHLFKRFYRVARDTTQQISGSGIGLYVVREIVTSHAGTIQATSTEGAGSSFTVRLPLQAAEPGP